VTLLKPDIDCCEQCRSAMDKPGYRVTQDGGKRMFLCQDHLIAALRNGLIPRRTAIREAKGE
jgi:hypothetical protein